MSPAKVATRWVVIDGSNLATESRTAPSLAQLEEAVAVYRSEDPTASVVVVADATFEHRVGPSERTRFKEAELAGRVVTPPAGVVGRGDAFILKIADRIGAVVVSNDSFQEFQETYPWLFDEGRLVGGKPVPGVGWIFTPRIPVRRSRVVRTRAKAAAPSPPAPVRAAVASRTPKKVAAPATKSPVTAKPSAKTAKDPVAKAARPPARTPAAKGTATATRGAAKATKSAAKTARATPSKPPPRPAKAARSAEEAGVAPATALRRNRQPVNPEKEFALFVAQHRLKSLVMGEVVTFTSHGAVIAVEVGGQRVECYAPTTSLGTPPPARARDLLQRGEQRKFRLVSIDKDRRIAELALP